VITLGTFQVDGFKKRVDTSISRLPKGKEQYLDSLGGNHGIASEGKYLKASVYHPISPEKCDYERMEGEEFSEIS
jgi:hypothetical protein